MSWFSEIAGKAEDLLNRVDQSAASALQNKTKSSVYNPDSPYHKQNHSNLSENNELPAHMYFTNQSPLRSVSSASSLLESRPTPSPRKKPESDDEKLMRFLNSNEVDIGSLCSTKSETIAPKMDLSAAQPSPKQANIEDYESKTTSTETTVHDAPKEPSSDHNFSECEAINKVLLPEEVLPDLQKQISNTNTGETYVAYEAVQQNTQVLGNDKLVCRLKEKENDMIIAMDAKDSQLAVLKVRFQEVDQDLARKSRIIQELQNENDRIIKEHAHNALAQNKTIEIIQEQLSKSEAELKKAQDFASQSEIKYMQKMAKVEEEQRILSENYSSLQKKWNDLNEKSKELSSQLKHTFGNLEALRLEYNDYKQKAQRILQSKEKLISSLKEDSLEIISVEKSETASTLLNAEMEGLKQERDLLQDEIRRAKEMTETYRMELQEMEKMSQGELMIAEEQKRILREHLDVEQEQKEELNMQIMHLNEEIHDLQDSLSRTKSSFQSRIQDKEIEIEKLRRQLTAKSLSSVGQDELESRLHILTENLIQKQTLVEALSTEKNSLTLQLERLEHQLKEVQNSVIQQTAYVGINNVQERKVKTVFLENPFDSSLTRKAKKMYGSIDAISIRLGVFFRRYPIARMLVIIYMLLLHFWVMIVLLTYEPEVHNAVYEKDS